jgi:protein SCO1/2
MLLLTISLSGANKVEVGVDEHLGQTIPLDLKFVNEKGDTVLLKDLIKKPTVLSLVYFRCPGICSPLLDGVVEVSSKVKQFKIGQDFQLLTISFDPTDTPALARQKKKNYMAQFPTPIPDSAWIWLTGDEENIKKLTDAIGFRYVKDGRDFRHPGLLTILSQEGKITRYLYGITFLPFDIQMSIVEASKGKVGPTLTRVLAFCYSYDPEGKTYAFNFLKVMGYVTILSIGFFVAVLLILSKKKKKEK